MVALRTSGNMLTPPPSWSRTMQRACGPHEHDSRLCPTVYFAFPHILMLGFLLVVRPRGTPHTHTSRPQ
eukprot:9340370-Pyramimonas_sp.AAC.1